MMINSTLDMNAGAAVHAHTTVGGLLSPDSQNVESGYLSGGTTSKIQLINERATPKQYSSSQQLDQGFNSQNVNSKQQTNMIRHKMAVQNSIKNTSTPMSSGGRRVKRVSAYEASDDESVLEFQHMENQLLRDGGASTRKSNKHLTQQAQNNQNQLQQYQQQDAATPFQFNSVTNSGENSNSRVKKQSNAKLNSDSNGNVQVQQSKFKTGTISDTNKKQNAQNNNANNNQGFSSKLQQQQNQNTSMQPNKKSSNSLNQKQNQTKPIAVPPPSVQTNGGNMKIGEDKNSNQQQAKAKSGGCCGIFCCGYCCSKGAGLSEKDKTQEMDLRPEQKQVPDVQDIISPNGVSKLDNYKYGMNEQDLSLIDEVVDNQSVSQSHANSSPSDINQQQLITDSQVIEQEEMDHLDIDELCDEEKIELDLRSDIKHPMSGINSAGGNQRSFKSSTDPVDSKVHSHSLVNMNYNNPQLIDGVVQQKVDCDEDSNLILENSFDLDRKNLQTNLNRNSQPRLIQDGDLDQQHMQYNSVPHPERRYSNDEFMRIEGPSPESQLLMPMNKVNQSVDGGHNGAGNTNEEQHSQKSNSNRNNKSISDRKSSAHSGGKPTLNAGGVHQRVIGDQMNESGGLMEDIDLENDNNSQLNHDEEENTIQEDEEGIAAGIVDNVHNYEEDSSLRDIANESDKTIENDQDQYKLVQAKRMYVIHEVDEDTFSERSSNRQKSRVFNNNNNNGSNSQQEKVQSAYNDNSSAQNEYQNSLQALKEEPDEEDVYGLGSAQNMKHQHTLSMENDLSSMQINASQDIEPHNISQQLTAGNNPYQQSQKSPLEMAPVSQQKRSSQTQTRSPLTGNTGKQSNALFNEEGQLFTVQNQLFSKSETKHSGAYHHSSKSLGNSKSASQVKSSAKAQATQQVSPFNDPEGETQIDLQIINDQRHSKSLVNFQQYMEIEEAKQKQQQNQIQEIGQSPQPKRAVSNQSAASAPHQANSNGLYQLTNISPINKSNQIIPRNLSFKEEEKQSFFRPHNQNQNNKGKAAPNSNQQAQNLQEKQQQEEVIIFMEDFTGNNTPQKSSQTVKKLVSQPDQESRGSVIIQKVALDKSKLTQTYYHNFDQFMVANSINIDEQTKKAVAQSNFKESRDNSNPFLSNEDNNLANLQLQQQQQSDKQVKNSTSKDQALQKLLQRESLTQQKQHSEALQVKEKAKRKEKERLAKQQCAIKIQKLWKGHVQRKEYVDIRDNLRVVKQVRRLFEQRYKQMRAELINSLSHGLKDAKATKDREEQEMMTSFLSLCAVKLQSAWRGHHFRSVVLPPMAIKFRAEQKFKAFVRGWKLRKVMQTREIFAMSQHIKDLTKVQEYFLYTEKNENLLLMAQLNKDRKRAIEGLIEVVSDLQEGGRWIKSYIGNKIIENNINDDDQQMMNSTYDGLESQFKSPIRDHKLLDLSTDGSGQLRELVTTGRFLYDEDLERNPYIFETDEFIHQKFLDRRQQDYQKVDIEFVDQKGGSGNKSQGKNRNKLKAVDDDSSRQDDSESAKLYHSDKQKNSAHKKKFKDQSFESDFRSSSLNPRDNLALPKNKKTFDQMLEDAISMERGNGSQSSKKNRILKNSGSKDFLKRKEKYDPQKSLMGKKNDINSKNVEKKRIFKSKNRNSEDSFDDEEGQDREFLYSEEQQLTHGNQKETRNTFKNRSGKNSDQSLIMLEEEPMSVNKTLLPPSLLQKLYQEQIKMEKFLRTDTGRPVGINKDKYQPLNKNQQIYPTMIFKGVSRQNNTASLCLAELENIFDVYHGSGGKDVNSFLKGKEIRRDAIKDTQIPLLKEKSLFFKYYEDRVHECMMDDAKRDYNKSTREQRKWMFHSQKLY